MIRELARQGVSLSELSRRTGRDRKTLRKVLQEPEPQLHRQTSRPRASKLEPYRDYLLGRVDQGCLNATVLLEEIMRLGYTGKITIVRDLLRPVRQELRRKQEATERFETAPGQQAQVDWAHFGHIWDPDEGRWRKVYAFIFTLGYSRAQYLTFVTSCDMEHFLACHLEAFAALGIPERILYDNLKTAILGHYRDGTPIFPGRFLDFALYYGFSPRFCQPYRARTKGKVERGVGYVRQNFWVRVSDEVKNKQLVLAGLNQRAQDWVATVANVRVHGTHGQVVQERYAAEEPLLAKVDGRPRYDTSYHALRRVGRDGRLSYRGRIYQVGLTYALGEVQVTENLNGQVTIRGKDGQVLRAQVVLAGQVTGEGKPEQRQGHRPEPGSAELLLVVPVAAPLVQTRDLAVYEEVARAATVD